MAARRDERLHEKYNICICFACKGLSNDDVGGARGTVLKEIRPGAGFKTGDFVKEVLGGLPQNDSGERKFCPLLSLGIPSRECSATPRTGTSVNTSCQWVRPKVLHKKAESEIRAGRPKLLTFRLLCNAFHECTQELATGTDPYQRANSW